MSEIDTQEHKLERKLILHFNDIKKRQQQHRRKQQPLRHSSVASKRTPRLTHSISHDHDIMTSQTRDAHSRQLSADERRTESVRARKMWMTSLSNTPCSPTRTTDARSLQLPGTPSPELSQISPKNSERDDVCVTQSPFDADVSLVISKPPNAGAPLALRSSRTDHLQFTPAHLPQMAAVGRGINLSTTVTNKQVASTPSQPQPLSGHVPSPHAFTKARPPRSSISARQPVSELQDIMTSRHRVHRHSLMSHSVDDASVYQSHPFNSHLPGAGTRRRQGTSGSDVGAPTYRPTQPQHSDVMRLTQAAALKQVQPSSSRHSDSKQAWR